MKAYKSFFKSKNFRNAEIKSKQIFSLPLYPELETKKVLYICSELKKILKDV